MRKLLLIYVLFSSVLIYSQSQEDIKTLNVSKDVKSSKMLSDQETDAKTNVEEKTYSSTKLKKEKYLIFNTSDFRTQNNIPSSFPLFIDSGDMYKDTKSYDIAIKQWINKHPEEYKQIKEIINF